MVQKSGSPPGMVLKPCKELNGKKLPSPQLVNAGFLNHQQYVLDFRQHYTPVLFFPIKNGEFHGTHSSGTMERSAANITAWPQTQLLDDESRRWWGHGAVLSNLAVLELGPNILDLLVGCLEKFQHIPVNGDVPM